MLDAHSHLSVPCRSVGDLLESVNSPDVAALLELDWHETEPFEPIDSVLLLVLLVCSPPGKHRHTYTLDYLQTAALAHLSAKICFFLEFRLQ